MSCYAAWSAALIYPKGQGFDAEVFRSIHSAIFKVIEEQVNAGRPFTDTTEPIPNCPLCGGPMRWQEQPSSGVRRPEWVCQSSDWDPMSRMERGCGGVLWPADSEPVLVG